MFARLAKTLVAFALIGAAPAPAPKPPTGGNALVEACNGRDGWSDAAPPARIFGNTYYVGTCGITVLLITSKRGHVLIDSGPAEAVPSILANIRTLGFRPRDVKLIVGSHEHVDHMGGMAALKAATGARIAAREPARAVLESGKVDVVDPQLGIIADMVPVKVDLSLSDNGGSSLVAASPVKLAMVSTPGHTKGGTSWTWRSCEAQRCLAFAYVDSLSAVSRDGYRFSDHPERVAPFRATFASVAAMPCDVLITPHPGVSDLFARLAGKAPLIDRAACKQLADASAAKLNDRLAREKTQ